MQNPFQSESTSERSPLPATVVIFGASGDLTRRKLLPAIYKLSAERLIPRIKILGTSRTALSDDAFRAHLQESLRQHGHADDEALWSSFAQDIHYQKIDYEDPQTFDALAKRIRALDEKSGLPPNRLFYLSTPPTTFLPIIQNLGRVGLTEDSSSSFARVVVEKPFGVSLETAQTLNREIQSILREDQIYRIDHYLGKETVQNLLVFRFANGIFEPLWNNKHIDHVQIIGAETLGIGTRGAYFDRAGILRDMVQNHLMQVLCLAAMEPPVSFEAEAVRNEKVKVLRALRPIEEAELTHHVIRAQYTKGSVLGRIVPAYREEQGVAHDSQTETFVALKLAIDNWRWAGVPFYLRSGKRMPKRVTEIAIHFKQAPHRIFPNLSMADTPSNILSVRIQPDEGISLSIGSKVPGPSMEIAKVMMEFRYASSFGVEPPGAYERLLLDALIGDGTLFTRGDEAEASWALISPIHQAWSASETMAMSYEAGSWGPEEAKKLVESDGRVWRRP